MVKRTLVYYYLALYAGHLSARTSSQNSEWFYAIIQIVLTSFFLIAGFSVLLEDYINLFFLSQRIYGYLLALILFGTSYFLYFHIYKLKKRYSAEELPIKITKRDQIDAQIVCVSSFVFSLITLLLR